MSGNKENGENPKKPGLGDLGDFVRENGIATKPFDQGEADKNAAKLLAAKKEKERDRSERDHKEFVQAVIDAEQNLPEDYDKKHKKRSGETEIDNDQPRKKESAEFDKNISYNSFEDRVLKGDVSVLGDVWKTGEVRAFLEVYFKSGLKMSKEEGSKKLALFTEIFDKKKEIAQNNKGLTRKEKDTEFAKVTDTLIAITAGIIKEKKENSKKTGNEKFFDNTNNNETRTNKEAEGDANTLDKETTEKKETHSEQPISYRDFRKGVLKGETRILIGVPKKSEDMKKYLRDFFSSEMGMAETSVDREMSVLQGLFGSKGEIAGALNSKDKNKRIGFDESKKLYAALDAEFVEMIKEIIEEHESSEEPQKKLRKAQDPKQNKKNMEKGERFKNKTGDEEILAEGGVGDTYGNGNSSADKIGSSNNNININGGTEGSQDNKSNPLKESKKSAVEKIKIPDNPQNLSYDDYKGLLFGKLKNPEKLLAKIKARAKTIDELISEKKLETQVKRSYSDGGPFDHTYYDSYKQLDGVNRWSIDNFSSKKSKDQDRSDSVIQPHHNDFVRFFEITDELISDLNHWGPDGNKESKEPKSLDIPGASQIEKYDPKYSLGNLNQMNDDLDDLLSRVDDSEFEKTIDSYEELRNALDFLRDVVQDSDKDNNYPKELIQQNEKVVSENYQNIVDVLKIEVESNKDTPVTTDIVNEVGVVEEEAQKISEKVSSIISEFESLLKQKGLTKDHAVKLKNFELRPTIEGVYALNNKILLGENSEDAVREIFEDYDAMMSDIEFLFEQVDLLPNLEEVLAKYENSDDVDVLTREEFGSMLFDPELKDMHKEQRQRINQLYQTFESENERLPLPEAEWEEFDDLYNGIPSFIGVENIMGKERSEESIDNDYDRYVRYLELVVILEKEKRYRDGETTYKESRKDWKESNTEWIEARNEFNTELAEYYKSEKAKNSLTKSAKWARSLWSSPELPEELRLLKERDLEARMNHSKQLSRTVSLRKVHNAESGEKERVKEEQRFKIIESEEGENKEWYLLDTENARATTAEHFLIKSIEKRREIYNEAHTKNERIEKGKRGIEKQQGKVVGRRCCRLCSSRRLGCSDCWRWSCRYSWRRCSGWWNKVCKSKGRRRCRRRCRCWNIYGVWFKSKIKREKSRR